MTEVLDNIIQAIREKAYIMSLHYWINVVNEPRRPLPSAIISSIGNDEPEIIEDNLCDPRGASCLILGVNGQGNEIHSLIGYEHDPITIITAYYPDNRFLDGRIRRQK